MGSTTRSMNSRTPYARFLSPPMRPFPVNVSPSLFLSHAFPHHSDSYSQQTPLTHQQTPPTPPTRQLPSYLAAPLVPADRERYSAELACIFAATYEMKYIEVDAACKAQALRRVIFQVGMRMVLREKCMLCVSCRRDGPRALCSTPFHFPFHLFPGYMRSILIRPYLPPRI